MHQSQHPLTAGMGPVAPGRILSQGSRAAPSGQGQGGAGEELELAQGVPSSSWRGAGAGSSPQGWGALLPLQYPRSSSASPAGELGMCNEFP